MYGILSSYISRGVYTFSGPFHPFGGAVDIIVVEQQDGSFKSSPWYVRFGKFQGVLKTREKIVNICVNGVDANFHMYLDHKGEAFFLEEVDVEEGKSMLYSSSLSSGDERDEESSGRRPTKSKSCNFDTNREIPLAPIDASPGKIVPRTTSRRGRLLGLVFGGKSMKQESFGENESGADIPRVSSLERAEIAADLLEVRWTTSLATKNQKKDKASQFSAEDSLDTIADVDGKIRTTLCVNEDMEDGSDPSHLQEENGFCDGGMSNKSQSGFHNSESSVGEASLEVSCLGAPVETSALNVINLGGKYELSEISRMTNEVTDADHHDNVKCVTFSITCSESQIPDPAEVEVGSCEQFNAEAVEERNAVLSDHDVLEENEQDRVQSFLFCGTSGSSAVGLDGSIKETQETLYLACGESGESHVHAETLHEITELIPETQVLDIIHQHPVTERLVEEIKSEAKPAKVPENQSQHSSPSYSCMPANVEAGFEGSLVMQESYTEMVRVDSKLDSAEETISHGSFTISSFSDSGHAQCNETIRDEKKKSELQPSLVSFGDSQEFDGHCVPTKVVTIIAPPESSSFSDSGHVQCNEIIIDEKKKSELQPSLDSIGDSQEFDGDYVPTKVMTISPPASSSFSDSGHVQCNEIIRDEKKKSELQPSLESIGDSQEFDGDCVPTKVMTISPPASSSFSDSGHVQCNEIIRDEKKKSELQPSLESIGDSQEFDGDCVPTKVMTISPPESSSFSDSGHVQCSDIIRDEKKKSELQPSLESIGDSQEFDGDCVPTKVRTISPPESSSFSCSGHVQCNEIIRDEKKKSELQPSLESIGDSQEFDGDCVPTKVMTISPPESSDEEQFLFSDLEDMKHSEVQSMDLISLDPMEKENSPSLILDGNEKIDDLFDANYESYSSPDSSVQDNPPDDLYNLRDKSRVVSSPISIPSSVKVTGEEVAWLAESLPNMGPCSDDLDAHELHRTISHSLDSNSKSLGWALLRNNISTFTKSNADNKCILEQEQLSIDDTQISRELKNILANPDVEISLCKHLLHEGMGAAAASQAFDAEKLDIDKFASLGPDVLKKDNLVVRIRGHYYPWEAAAPIVLGMLSFGKEQIHELKDMIAVDQLEKTLEGDPSKAVVASGGSWRLWPFPFRRSRAIPSVQPAIVNTRQFDSENAKETTAGMDGNSSVCKPKLTKKKVRVVAPTSEQLASLNLKEGRNTITFTFSTAMLGKQQVDARIYLWKWNTRIVISDVDGTITKSDVLGQFMPMVGVDWSQTGVTHLFSAIKENGYQLIFLSARSISQAYLTRQFLFNLKQDGKALPDGPVVISPDGLFPSLYREVIRRAPHEFKIACLEDIRVLFPSDCNPFYAGFGNRDTDEISYLKVGIPKGKIFIINPKGEVAVNRLVDTKSYTSLHALVNGMFPPTSTSSSVQEDFNSWNYWRLPPPDVDM